MFIDNHIKQLHLQKKKKNTLTRDINRVKQKKKCQIITGGVTGLKEIIKKYNRAMK